MKVTIIHKYECPPCYCAIEEFTGDGHEVELYHDLDEIKDAARRRNMMSDMMCGGGDKDVFPQVFIYDRFVPWKPKTNRKGE